MCRLIAMMQSRDHFFQLFSHSILLHTITLQSGNDIIPCPLAVIPQPCLKHLPASIIAVLYVTLYSVQCISVDL